MAAGIALVVVGSVVLIGYLFSDTVLANKKK